MKTITVVQTNMNRYFAIETGICGAKVKDITDNLEAFDIYTATIEKPYQVMTRLEAAKIAAHGTIVDSYGANIFKRYDVYETIRKVKVNKGDSLTDILNRATDCDYIDRIIEHVDTRVEAVNAVNKSETTIDFINNDGIKYAYVKYRYAMPFKFDFETENFKIDGYEDILISDWRKETEE